MPIKSNLPYLQQAVGMFTHYAYWIPSYSEKVHPLTVISKLPLPRYTIRIFEDLKSNIAEATVTTIDSSVPLVVEKIRQSGQPVAFFSRTISWSEWRHSVVKKVVYTIVALESGNTI